MTTSTKRSGHRAWVEVDLANLLANGRTAQAAARGALLLPMVKAEAYGLGAVEVVRALETLAPWGFGVATVDEGIQLREAGVERPIVVFTPARGDQLDVLRTHDLRAVIDDPGVARSWDRQFHLEIDTGMSRCGVRWDEATALRDCATHQLEGVFTHFYAADESAEVVRMQWERFERALEALGTRPPLVHAANSAALWRLDQSLDLVRPGIFLYGGRPGPDLPMPEPVIRLRAPVVSVRRLPAGERVSYGGEWTAPAPTTVATLGIGYADGVPRAVAGRAHVLLGGVACPVVGRVTMDFTMVAVDDATSVRVGDVATVIGADGDREITLDRFAEWAGTISYEILTGLGPRVPREYRRP